MSQAPQDAASAGGALARLDRWYAHIEDYLNYVAAAVIFAMMLFVCAEAILRTAFNASIYGFLDLTELSMAAFAFLGAAYCQRLGGHIRMDLMVAQLRGRWLWGAEAVATLVALLVVGILVSGTFDHFLRAWRIGDTTIDAELRTWPSKLLAPIGLSFLFLRLALNFAGYLRLVRDPDAEPVAVPPRPGEGHAAPNE